MVRCVASGFGGGEFCWSLALEAVVVNLSTVLSAKEERIETTFPPADDSTGVLWKIPDDSRLVLSMPVDGVICLLGMPDDVHVPWKRQAMMCLLHLRRAIEQCHANGKMGMGVSACDIEIERADGELWYYWNVKKPVRSVPEAEWRYAGWHNSFQSPSALPYVDVPLPKEEDESALIKFDLDCWKTLSEAVIAATCQSVPKPVKHALERIGSPEYYKEHTRTHADAVQTRTRFLVRKDLRGAEVALLHCLKVLQHTKMDRLKQIFASLRSETAYLLNKTVHPSRPRGPKKILKNLDVLDFTKRQVPRTYSHREDDAGGYTSIHTIAPPWQVIFETGAPWIGKDILLEDLDSC